MWTPPIQTLNHEHRPSKEISSTLLLVGLVNLIFFIYVLAVPFPNKISKVTPVDKGDNDLDPSNYPPISTLSVDM